MLLRCAAPRVGGLCRGVLVVLVAALAAPAPAAEGPPVTLLVHGVKLRVDGPTTVWGRLAEDDSVSPAWDGLIGHLITAGHRYGGLIRPRGTHCRLPQCLDTTGAHRTGRANLFVLEFSPAANADGLAYKTLELADTIAALRRYTGAKKVALVAHSGGGLVARVYLQSAMPGVPYRGDVDRLITIATPHLGSEMAEHWGDFLGTRVTALGHQSGLVGRLNHELELPGDVRFASIVVRGVGIGLRGTRGEADAYRDSLDAGLLAALPLDYREGGDQVVHVCSQNLRLAPCARRYEAAAGKPVLDLLARVEDPSPGDWCCLQETVHEACCRDPQVADLVALLLRREAGAWRAADADTLRRWAEHRAWWCAFAAIERQAADEHALAEVRRVQVDELEPLARQGDRWRFRFSGTARARGRMLRLMRFTTQVEGTVWVRCDDYGRLIAAGHQVRRVDDRWW